MQREEFSDEESYECRMKEIMELHISRGFKLPFYWTIISPNGCFRFGTYQSSQTGKRDLNYEFEYWPCDKFELPYHLMIVDNGGEAVRLIDRGNGAPEFIADEITLTGLNKFGSSSILSDALGSEQRRERSKGTKEIVDRPISEWEWSMEDMLATLIRLGFKLPIYWVTVWANGGFLFGKYAGAEHPSSLIEHAHDKFSKIPPHFLFVDQRGEAARGSEREYLGSELFLGRKGLDFERNGSALRRYSGDRDDCGYA